MKEMLQGAIERAVRRAMQDGAFSADALPAIVLEVPPQKEFGDFATNFALQAARCAKAKPRLIAEAIVARLREDWLEKAEVAGPGFINFYLKTGWLYEMLAAILAKGRQYGDIDAGRGERVQVEYVSANPTGPLHVGHGRGAAVGSALVNLLRAAGYAVKGEYYINDAGNQIDHLAASVNARYLELLGRPAEFPADGYHGQDIVATARRIVDKYGDRYVKVPAAQRLAAFKELALQEKLQALKEDLAAFNVHFDVWFSERSLHQTRAVEKACAALEENGNLYQEGGALWLKSTAYGDDKDRVVIRDNGAPTYLAADIAYHRDKFERGFDTLINIWGADHHGYICRVKAAMAALGYDASRLEVLILQMVSLYRDGELVKMSKRTGQSVTLAELIEEVGCDAARFFFIMRSIDSQLDFDLSLAKSKSNENPVYYVQYVHARICSLFRRVAEVGVKLPEARLEALVEPFEIDLIKKLGAYEEEIAAAAHERAPHRIARYVHELAGLFHAFYSQCRIISAAETSPQLLERAAARLALITAVRNVIAHALAILGVTAPEKM